MASPLDAEIVAGVHEENDLLSKIRSGRQCGECLDNIVFFLVTLLVVSDMVTDLMVTVQYGKMVHVPYLAVGIMSLIVCHFGTGMLYAIQMKGDGHQSMIKLYGCLVLNFPCHLGVIAHRFNHNCHNCESCFDESLPQTHGITLHTMKNETNWKFCKIKLMQSLFQCVPQLLLNLLHMLTYGSPSTVQIVSAGLSYASLIIGLARYEKTRREYTRGYALSAGRVLCVVLSQSLVISGRLLAILVFLYLYGAWLAVLLIPHMTVVFLFYLVIYRHSWRVQYYKVIVHSVYCVVSYFPVSTEYRPEGEAMMYYALHITENVLMVCLPYAVPPTMRWVQAGHSPPGRLYLAVMLLGLCTSTSGILLHTLYACFLHNPHQNPCRDFRLCTEHVLRQMCPWSRLSELDDEQMDAASCQFEAQPYRSQTLYAADDPHNLQPGMHPRCHSTGVEDTYMPTTTCSGPPGYHTLKDDDDDIGTPPELMNSPDELASVCGGSKASTPATDMRLMFEELPAEDTPIIDDDSETETAETPLHPAAE